MCNVDENGRVTWPMGEAITFACPFSSDRQSDREQAAKVSTTSNFEGTNGKKRLCLRDEMDQPQTSLGEKILREDD